jgi:hypothetical protein
MVRLTPEMSDEQIVAQVIWWVEHGAAAQARAAESQHLALARFTMESYAEQFVTVARRFLDQARHCQSGWWQGSRLGRTPQKVKTWLTRAVRRVERLG